MNKKLTTKLYFIQTLIYIDDAMLQLFFLIMLIIRTHRNQTKNSKENKLASHFKTDHLELPFLDHLNNKLIYSFYSQCISD